MIMSSDKVDKKEELLFPSDNVKVGATAGLLDFYSDRAVAHASFLLACVFGLFTLLAIVQGVNNLGMNDLVLIVVSMAPYGTIVVIGFHCLRRFSFYASMSEELRRILMEYVKTVKVSAQTREKGKRKEFTNLEEYEKKYLKKRFAGVLNKFKESKYRKYFEAFAVFLVFILPAIVVYLSKILQLLDP